MAMRRFLYILLLGLSVLCARPHAAFAEDDTWPLALKLMAAGQTETALPLLERLVSTDPNNKNYRFELAIALFRLDKNFRAKWQLDQIRGAELTPAEANMIEKFLAQITARSVWSGSFSIALKPESNATQQTSAEAVNVGGLDFILRPDARAKPGVSLLVAAGLGYSPIISDQWRGRFSINTNLRHNNDASLRDYQLSLRGGLQYQMDARKSIVAGLHQGFRWVGDMPYSSTTGFWVEHSRLVGTRGRLDFGLDLSKTHHHVALPASHRGLISANYSHALTGNARISAGGYLEQTQGNLPNLSGTRAGLSVFGLYAWNGGLMTSLELGQHVDQRRGPEPLFGTARKDQKTAISLTVYHRDLRIGSFAPTLVIGVEKNRSNIPLSRFDNQYMSIGLTREF
jgi:hypothetical protein